MQLLVKLLSNSLYGKQIRKYIDDQCFCISEYWMQTEDDERVKDFWRTIKLYFVELVQDDGIENQKSRVNRMQPLLGSFELSNSKQIMINFVEAIRGFKANDL